MDISITVTVKNVAPTDLEAVLAKIRSSTTWCTRAA